MGDNVIATKALVMSDLKRNGQIGDIEPGKVLTFNGDATGKYIYDYGSIDLVRISEAVIDLNAVTKVVLTVGGNNQELTDISTAELDENTDVIVAKMGEHAPTLVIVFKQDIGNEKKGVYFAYDPDGNLLGAPAWVSRIETPETIHPIDPKFLPGVCLPVVELSTAVDNEQVELTAAETAQLASALETSDLAIIKTAIPTLYFPLLVQAVDSDGERIYTARVTFTGVDGSGNPTSGLVDIVFAVLNGIGMFGQIPVV